MSRAERQGLNGQRTPRVKGQAEDMGHQAGVEKERPEASILWKKVLTRTSDYRLGAPKVLPIIFS